MPGLSSAVHSRPRLFAIAATSLCVAHVAILASVLSRRPPYFDETFYAYQGYLVHRFAAYRFVALLDGKGPMLNWLTAGVMQVHVPPLTALRVVTAAADVLTLLGIGLLTRHIAGRTTAIAAMAMYVVTPFQLIHGGMGTYEPLILLAATYLLYTQIRLAEKPRLLLGVAFGALTGFALLTKANGTLAVALVPISLVLFDWRTPHVFRRFALWGVSVGNGLLIGVLVYSVVRRSWPHSVPHTAQNQAQFHSPGFALRNAASIIATNWPAFRIELRDYLTLPLLLLVAAGLGLLLIERTRIGVLLTVWIVVPTAASVLVATKPLSRFLLPWIAPMFVAAGVAVVRIVVLVRDQIGLRRGAAVLTAAAVGLAMPALLFDGRWLARPASAALPGFDDHEFVTDWPAGFGYGAVVEALMPRLHRGDTIAMTPSSVSGHTLPVLLHDPGENSYRVIRIDDPDARSASYVIEEGVAELRQCSSLSDQFTWCSFVDLSRYKLLVTIRRPRHGDPLKLYAR